jgi:transcription elongation factor Elf1
MVTPLPRPFSLQETDARPKSDHGAPSACILEGAKRMPPTLTLGNLFSSTFPCFLCGQELSIRTDKNSKRYLVCDLCGLQAFVRKKDGIKRLEKLASEIRGARLYFENAQREVRAMQAVIKEIDEIKNEIAQTEKRIGILFPDPDLVRIKEALERKLQNSLQRLDSLAQKGEPEKNGTL